MKLELTEKDDQFSFFIRQNGVLNKIAWTDIFYVLADGNYCYLHTSTKKFVIKISMRKLADRLENLGFLRIHKSFLVQLHHIDQIDVNNNVVHILEEELPIGRAFKKVLLEKVDIL